MANPPSITVSPGNAEYLEFVVTANSVDPVSGVNTAAVDLTTPLTFTAIQGSVNGASATVTFAQVAMLPDGTRVVRIAAGNLQPGSPPAPWSVRVGASGRTATSQVTGTSIPAPDLSGVSWNGVDPSPIQPS